MSRHGRIAGTGLVALTMAVAGCTAGTPDATSTAGGTPAPSATTATATPDANPTPSASPSGAPATTGPTTSATAKPSATPAVLSGRRQVTIVRVDAFESGLSLLDDGRLGEADDDSGRQLFVPTPVRGQKFLIKAYRGSGGGGPLCWQVRNPGNTQPLSVGAATCKADDPRQQFEIAPATTGGDRAYVIGNAGAFLRYSGRNGLILEELGDGPPAPGFRFNDNGPAPA